MSKYTYTCDSEVWECGDGCCTEWNDEYKLYKDGEFVKVFIYYDDMLDHVLKECGATLELINECT